MMLCRPADFTAGHIKYEEKPAIYDVCAWIFQRCTEIIESFLGTFRVSGKLTGFHIILDDYPRISILERHEIISAVILIFTLYTECRYFCSDIPVVSFVWYDCYTVTKWTHRIWRPCCIKVLETENDFAGSVMKQYNQWVTQTHKSRNHTRTSANWTVWEWVSVPTLRGQSRWGERKQSSFPWRSLPSQPSSHRLEPALVPEGLLPGVPCSCQKIEDNSLVISHLYSVSILLYDLTFFLLKMLKDPSAETRTAWWILTLKEDFWHVEQKPRTEAQRIDELAVLLR